MKITAYYPDPEPPIQGQYRAVTCILEGFLFQGIVFKVVVLIHLGHNKRKEKQIMMVAHILCLYTCPPFYPNSNPFHPPCPTDAI